MDLDPVKLVAGLKARKLLILGCTFAFAALAGLAGKVMPKSYESHATVQVNSLQRDTLTGRVEVSYRVSEFLGQQAAIAQSRTVALVVIDRLIEEGYLSMEDFTTAWREATTGEAIAGNDARLWAADQLLLSLTVTGNALASSLVFSFESRDPAQASKIANSFANSYMETVLDQRQRQAARNAQEFSDETFSIAKDVERAQDELSAYRVEAGIVGSSLERLEAAEILMEAITARLGDARADLREAETFLSEARRVGRDGILNLPLETENLPGRQAQVRLGAVQIQLNRIAERFGENYPDFQELNRERIALERNIMKSISNRALFAKRRVDELENELAQQTGTVLALQERKQTFDDLQKTVESRRGAYDLVTARSLQESLQSRINAVDVLMLSRAVPSPVPTLPGLPILVIVGAVLGFGFGIVLAVIVELMQQRVRLGQTVGKSLNAPVLGELTIPSIPVDNKPSKHLQIEAQSRELAA